MNYSDEKNAQVILAILKEHGIRKVVASPGTTNMALVVSMENDNFFEMYSSVDERSAAYLACGLANESGEPVVLSCTGATASRNYLPGLTEAYYRKLPILSITSTQSLSKIGHHIAQVIDRSSLPKDVVKYSVTLPIVKDDDDLWDCEIKVNTAILELIRHGGGPVHINLPTTYSRSFATRVLPRFRLIKRIVFFDEFPEIPKGKVAIFIGAHSKMTPKQTSIIDQFCATNNSVVFCDHTSGYKGKYRVLFALAAAQNLFNAIDHQPDLLIHIGEISGDYYSIKMAGKEVWRVSEDGEIRDTFRKLTYVFEMSETHFLEYYSKGKQGNQIDYLEECKKQLNGISIKTSDLPFSNIWFASKMAGLIPIGSTIHFGILNSLRSWNFFELPDSVESASNVGGFGIDGGLSALIGASLFNKNKLYFCVIGDLAFFYDMNVLGNRHVGNNLRIFLVNNGKGTEFRQFNHSAAQHGDAADGFVAAAGHFGNKSKSLVKNYAQNLGFDYLSASSKEQFEKVYKQFLDPQISGRSLLFEVFTNSDDESDALKVIMNYEKSTKAKAKEITESIIGKTGFNIIKKILK